MCQSYLPRVLVRCNAMTRIGCKHDTTPNSTVECAGAVNDYQKDLQFKKLNAQKDIIEVKVLRNGEDQLIGNEEIVVGDVLLLDTGDKVRIDVRRGTRTSGNISWQ